MNHSSPRALGTGTFNSTGSPRRRKILRDNIYGITKPAIRRMARRGGVRRISADIYDECRLTIRKRLEVILQKVALVVTYRGEGQKGNRAPPTTRTVTTGDIIFVLRLLGTPISGFEKPE